MPWSTLTLSDDTVKGNAPVTFYDPEIGIDTERLSPEVIEAAKRRVRRRIVAAVPETARAELGGTAGFLDAAADDDELEPFLEEAVLFAALMAYAEEEGLGPDDVARWEARFEEAFGAFLSEYPGQLGDEDAPPVIRRAASHTTGAATSYGAGYP